MLGTRVPILEARLKEARLCAFLDCILSGASGRRLFQFAQTLSNHTRVEVLMSMGNVVPYEDRFRILCRIQALENPLATDEKARQQGGAIPS